LLDRGKGLDAETPELVREAKKNWVKDTLNFIEHFVTDKIEFTQNDHDQLTTENLFQAYMSWRQKPENRHAPTASGVSAFGKKCLLHTTSCIKKMLKSSKIKFPI
jgi:hypothetical protein